MHAAAVESSIPAAQTVRVTEDSLTVELSDGRSLSVLLAWFPQLAHSTPTERKNWRLIGRSQGTHWDTPDEEISVEGLLAGEPS